MKILAIALTTFESLLRNKVLILFSAAFACVVLLMVSPLLMIKTFAPADEAQSFVVNLISSILGLMSGFGTFLAAWASAVSVWDEMKSGTILAILARPVRRWEFLLGKYAGVQLLMCVYVVGLLAATYLLAWIGETQILSSPWTLLAYPLARYGIYSALALLLVTLVHPLVALSVILVMATLTQLVTPGSRGVFLWPEWLQKGLYAVLPSTRLLAEERFLTLTHAQLQDVSWSSHLISLGYGLNYALILFLLAAWTFRSRSVIRD